MRQHRTSTRVIGMIGGFALLVAGAPATGERGASASAGDEVTIVAEFVQYDFAGKTPTVGPFELAALLHPASLGPAGVACTVDRIAVEDNHVELIFPESGGDVVGLGRLQISCEYHPTCGPVTAVVDVDLRGVYDAGTGLLTGDATVRTLDAEATSYGSVNDGPMTCGDRWTRPGMEFTTSWLFATADGTGYLSADPIAGDPVHRSGYFSASGGAVGTSGSAGGTDPNESDQAAAAAADRGDADTAAAASEFATDSDTADAETDAKTAAADTDAGAVAGSTADDGDGGAVSRIGLMIAFLLILAALVVGFRRRLLAFLRRGRDAPLPSSEPASPASRAVQQTTDSGAAADLDVAPDQTIAATVSPPPPTPAPPPSPPQEFQIIGSAEHGYRYVEAESDDGQVTRLHTGMKIRVVTQLEHMSLVKSTSGGPAVWVDRRDIQMVNPEAVNNE